MMFFKLFKSMLLSQVLLQYILFFQVDWWSVGIGMFSLAGLSALIGIILKVFSYRREGLNLDSITLKNAAEARKVNLDTDMEELKQVMSLNKEVMKGLRELKEDNDSYLVEISELSRQNSELFIKNGVLMKDIEKLTTDVEKQKQDIAKLLQDISDRDKKIGELTSQYESVSMEIVRLREHQDRIV